MKILALDLETRPNLAYIWKLFDENVGLDQLVEAHEVICFGAKWVGEKRRVEFYSVHHQGKVEMLYEAHRLLDESDAVVHWNGQRFDIPHLNREFLLAGFRPPSPFAQIDLMNVAKKQFRFPSNRLAHVSESLGIGSKRQTDFKLWLRCMEGDVRAWAEMKRYNIQDVRLLEDAYNKLLPWISSHPQRNLYDEGKGCPSCGSESVQRRGFAYTRVSKYRRYQCTNCGVWLRSSRRVQGAEIQRIGT